MSYCRFGSALDDINGNVETFFEGEMKGFFPDNSHVGVVECDVGDDGYRAQVALGWAKGEHDVVVVTMVVQANPGQTLCANHPMFLSGAAGNKVVMPQVREDGALIYEARLPYDCVDRDLYPVLMQCMSVAV